MADLAGPFRLVVDIALADFLTGGFELTQDWHQNLLMNLAGKPDTLPILRIGRREDFREELTVALVVIEIFDRDRLRFVGGDFDVQVLCRQAHFKEVEVCLIFQCGAKLVNDDLLRDIRAQTAHGDAPNRCCRAPFQPLGLHIAGNGNRLEGSRFTGRGRRGDHIACLVTGTGEDIPEGDLLAFDGDVAAQGDAVAGNGDGRRGNSDHQGYNECNIFHSNLFLSRKVLSSELVGDGHHFICGRNGFGVHLIGPLSADQLGDFLHRIHVGHFKIALTQGAETGRSGNADCRCTRGSALLEKAFTERLQSAFVEEDGEIKLTHRLKVDLTVDLNFDFPARVDRHAGGVLRDSDAWDDRKAVLCHDFTGRAELHGTGAGIGFFAARQKNPEITFALNGHVICVARGVQSALFRDPIDGGGLHTDADLDTGRNDCSRIGRGRTGAFHILIEQVLKLRALALEAGGRHVCDVVGDNINVKLLCQHTCGGNTECSHSLIPSLLYRWHFFDGFHLHVMF